MIRGLAHALTVAALVCYLPALNFLSNNPYAYFLYQFDLGTLAWVVVVFLVLPAAALAGLGFLLARASPGFASALFPLVLFTVAVRQLELLYFRPWAKAASLPTFRSYFFGLCLLAIILAAWKWHRHLTAFISTLVLPVVIAVFATTAVQSYRISRLHSPVPSPIVSSSSAPGHNIYVILIDGFPLEYVQTSDGYVDARIAPHFDRFLREDALWAPRNGSNGTSTLVSAPSIVMGRIRAADDAGLLRSGPTLLTLVDSRYKVTAFVPSLNVTCVPLRQECYPPPQPRNPRLAIKMLGFNYLKFTAPKLTRLLGPEPNWRTLPFETAGSSEVLSTATRLVAARPGTGHLMFIHTFFPDAAAARVSLDPKVDQMLGRVHSWDRQFGDFITTLKRSGSYQDSIVAVVSDHGVDLSQSPPYGHLAIPNRRILHTPLAVKPLGPSRPRVISRRTQNVDLLPTIADLAGWTLPDEIAQRLDGRSVLDTEYRERPLLFGQLGNGVFLFDWDTEQYTKSDSSAETRRLTRQ